MSEQIVPCRLLAQGNRDRQEGVAIARMGSKLLIRYRIQDGTERERWFTPDRFEIDLDVSALPRYRRETIAREVLVRPIEAVKNEHGIWRVPIELRLCEVCGGRIVVEMEYSDRYDGGHAAVAYASHNHIVRAEEVTEDD